jgi:hypothetical protein
MADTHPLWDFSKALLINKPRYSGAFRLNRHLWIPIKERVACTIETATLNNLEVNWFLHPISNQIQSTSRLKSLEVLKSAGVTE